jgi:galactoside O-acetyltransferase
MVSLRSVLGEKITQIFLRLGFLNLYHYTIYGNPSNVILGKNISLNNAILNAASGRIIIGDNVIFGHGIILTTGTHDYHKKGLDRIKAWPRSGHDIVIEDGAMIGSGAIILGKTRIGRNAVVGAGSLVNRDVEPDTLVAGVPAKVIRKIRYERNMHNRCDCR